MIRRSFKYFFGWVLVASCLSATLTTRAFADTPAQPGLRVSPAIVNMTVGKQTPVQKTQVTITNSYETPMYLSAELRSIDEQGVRLVPTGPLGGEFAKAISLSETDIVVPSRSTYQLDVEVRNRDLLSAGGHYASLMLTQEPTGQGASSLRPAVSVNLFVIKADGVRTDLRLEDVNLPHTFLNLPRNATLTFRNNGNTHVIPRAAVGVYSWDNQTLYAQSVVNISSVPLFPGKTMEYTAPVTSVKSIWTPKHLRLQTTYRIDGIDVELLRQSSFWYIPPIDILSVVIAGAALWMIRKQVLAFVRTLSRASRWVFVRLQNKFSRHQSSSNSDVATERIGSIVLQAHKRSAQDTIRQKASKVFAGHILKQAETTPETTSKSVSIKVINVSDQKASKLKTTKATKAKKTSIKKPTKKPTTKAKKPTTKTTKK